MIPRGTSHHWKRHNRTLHLFALRSLPNASASPKGPLLCHRPVDQHLLPSLHHNNMIPLPRLHLAPLRVPCRAWLQFVRNLFKIGKQAPSCFPA